MDLQKITFYLLLIIQILGGILLAAVNFEFLTSQIIPIICFTIFFFVSPFLLVLSIHEFIRDKENVMMSSIAAVASLAGIVVVITVFIEIINLMP